jgi:predicted PurR-regulated permease PerM
MADEKIQIVAADAELNHPKASRQGRRPRVGHWAMNFIGIGVIGALCYYGELVLVVILISVLLAFVLAPVVDLLQWFRLPRGAAAFLAVLLLIAAVGGIFYYSYNQATDFARDLPKYVGKVRAEVSRFRKRAESLEVLTPEHEKGVINVRPAQDWTDVLTRGFGSLGTALLAGSSVPLLAYFMLTWQEHVRTATVMLFPLENRHTAYVTLGLISAMVRSFMVGNLLIGVGLGAVSTVAFGVIHLPFFYFAGFLSGFLSLIPYLGILLAVVPPIFVGLGHLHLQGIVIIFLTVFGSHLLAFNILYPKVLGNRLQLNPLALTMALLIWGTLWGGSGLVLAVPITAAMKIVFDHVERLKPLGAWLGE